MGIWFYRLELKSLAYLCALHTLSEMGIYNTCFLDHVVMEVYPQNMLRRRQEENQALMMIDISFGPI